MSHVEFPGLGWSFDINSTAFSIGSFEIKWYGLLIATGFLLAVIYAMVMCKKMNINRSRLLDTIIVGLIAGVIGARLYYVIFYPGDKFIKDPISIFYIHEGGLGIYGGIIGALLVGGLFAKFRKQNVLAVLDIGVLGFLIGQAIGRWGNFVNQEAFGMTSLPWGMVSENTLAVSPDSPVHPCFFYESMWCVLGFIVLHIFTTKFRQYDGQTFLLYLIWYGTGRFFIEALRTDSLYVPYLPIKVSQLVAVVTILAGIVLLIVFRNRRILAGCGLKQVMAANVERVAAMNPLSKFEPAEKKDRRKKETDHKEHKDSHDTQKEHVSKTVKEESTVQEKTSPVSMEPQESVSAEEQADNEIEVNNQVIHEIIDNQSTEETTKQADEKDNKGANQNGDNH
ncbi:MAG: prolipoprotein diacylglyceryl transferase [Acutalibacteraceae bacterium]